jgi:NAD-dependent SIR2 family protein deacetylase
MANFTSSISPDRIFILAGADVSAESSIPTFRGVGGTARRYSGFTLSVARQRATRFCAAAAHSGI